VPTAVEQLTFAAHLRRLKPAVGSILAMGMVAARGETQPFENRGGSQNCEIDHGLTDLKALHAQEGNAQICTYAWAYRHLFNGSYSKWSQAYAKKVLSVATTTTPAELAGLGRFGLTRSLSAATRASQVTVTGNPQAMLARTGNESWALQLSFVEAENCRGVLFIYTILILFTATINFTHRKYCHSGTAAMIARALCMEGIS
jgi:hypothetical protein